MVPAAVRGRWAVMAAYRLAGEALDLVAAYESGSVGHRSAARPQGVVGALDAFARCTRRVQRLAAGRPAWRERGGAPIRRRG